jgi:cysteine desulfurase
MTSAWTDRLRQLRDQFWDALRENFGQQVVLNGHPTRRLPNTLNVSFAGKIGADVLARMPEVAASTGSACHEGSIQSSPVLRAMRVPPEFGMGAIRFSLGRMSTWEDLSRVVAMLAN